MKDQRKEKQRLKERRMKNTRKKAALRQKVTTVLKDFEFLLIVFLSASNCIACSEKSAQISVQNEKLSEYKRGKEDLSKLISCKTDVCDLDIIERVNEICREASLVKSEIEHLKEERLKITESVERQLAERDSVHCERVRSLESVVVEKENQMVQCSNMMKQKLLSATTETQQLQKRILNMEREKRRPAEGSLEQEMDSLKMVLDMKKEETDQVKAANNALKLEMERFNGLEIKLQVQMQKTEEMNAVINMKNDQLRQVLDEYDRVQQQLEVEVSAHLACQQELEKSQWSKEAFVLENAKRWKEISNQRMSGMVLDVVQKEKALAYSFNC